jgi:hypothetical protein
LALAGDSTMTRFFDIQQDQLIEQAKKSKTADSAAVELQC